MKAVFLILFIFLLIFLILRNLEISQVGELIRPVDTKPSKEKWMVVARVEIIDGKIVSMTRNLTESR